MPREGGPRKHPAAKIKFQGKTNQHQCLEVVIMLQDGMSYVRGLRGVPGSQYRDLELSRTPADARGLQW
jgi:hypothetical protein